MKPSRRDGPARLIGRLAIVLGALLAVTLPAWGIFAGGMLRDGAGIGAAIAFFAVILAMVSAPVIIVGAAALLLQFLVRQRGGILHPGLAAGFGALVGTALAVAAIGDTLSAAGLLLGAIPGAAIALAVMPPRPVVEFRQDDSDA